MREKIFNSLNLLAGVSTDVPEGRVFGLDGQTSIEIIIAILNILVLFVILYKLLYKPAKNMLAKRQDLIAGQFAEAEAREAQAQALINQYEEKLLEIRREREHALSEARLEAKRERVQIIAMAEREANKIKDDASKVLEVERQLLQRKTKTDLIELSTLLAEKTVKDFVRTKDEEDKFEESIEELKGASW